MRRIPVLPLMIICFATAAFTWRAATEAERFLPKAKASTAPKLDWTAPPPMCAPVKPTAFLAMPLPWSDPATWGGTKPVAGDTVTIPAGMHVLLDEDTPPLAGLTIEGILEFDQQDLELTAGWVMVMWELHIGSEAMPFSHQATISLNASNPNENIMGMGTRGLMVMGGLVELHGTPPAIPWTKINAHAPQGSNSLTLMENVDWSVGDEVAIAPTDYYEAGPTGNSVTQRLSLTAVNGTSLTLDGGLNAFRWGLLQYATTSGMSLTDTNPVTPPAPSGFTPTILDERAEVGNLTRNIVIQAPNDALWLTQGFGCHVMVMREGMVQGVAHVSGVEIRRGGQRGRLGRYPFHWHMLSYEGSQTLPDATGQYLRNSTVNESQHRGIVIHGTNGVEVSNNIVFDVRGHGVFFEDAAERRNVVDGNLVMHVRNAVIPLKQHETGERGASGFWIANPDNTVTNNTAADCGTNGFWLAFPIHPWGLCINVPINPSRLRFGVFDNNTAHTSRIEGIMLDFVESDPDGNVQAFQYLSTSNGQNPVDWSTIERFSLSRYTTWKNGHHGIWDRAALPDNFECVSADNCGRFFAGSGANGMIERCLIVGTSLNHLMNGTDRPNFTGEVPPSGVATYHSAFDIRHNIFLEFPAIANTRSGAFATNDYYIRPVDKGQVRNIDNLTINSHTGVKLMADFPHFALSGALHDPHDNWGGGPAEDNYYVYDTPFFTYNQTPTIVQPNAATSGGVLVEGPFYGINDFVVNNNNIDYEDYMEIHVERLDNSLNTIGNWTVEEAQPGWILAHMRHFAAHPSSAYTLDFPTVPEVFDVAVAMENMLTNNDTLILGVQFSGEYAVEELYTTTWHSYMNLNHGIYRNDYAAVADFASLLASPGETYWQDATNDRVWVKLVGGVQQWFNPGDFPPTADEELYRMFRLRLYGEPLRVSPKVLLQGPYNGTDMNDHLRTGIHLPLDEPYNALGFTHVGNGGGERFDVSAYYFEGDNAPVDWVFLELRDSLNPATVIATRSALLQRDGDVVDLDGLSPVAFHGVLPGNYHLAVRHRNHLGAMTGSTVGLSANKVPIDFTSIATYGTNAQTDLGGGRMGLWSGDGNANGVINAIDRNLFWRLQNGQPFTYQTSTADWNLNGGVNAVDRNLFWRLNNGRVQQLP
ncbi:MAG: right-handed parallel beta-helix repeat-containing protein [Saprospiraceae bacterium]|nr:right-handed parallel beta-helix repeat-containing protein [Saprospiraceae bacterium]